LSSRYTLSVPPYPRPLVARIPTLVMRRIPSLAAGRIRRPAAPPAPRPVAIRIRRPVVRLIPGLVVSRIPGLTVRRVPKPMARRVPTRLPPRLKTHLPAHPPGPRSLSSSRLGRLSHPPAAPLPLSFRRYPLLHSSSISKAHQEGRGPSGLGPFSCPHGRWPPTPTLPRR
jgi:hypothetical protein